MILLILSIIVLVILFSVIATTRQKPKNKDNNIIKTETMDIYNVTTSDQPTEVVNRNVADAYGQIYYSGILLPGRKPDWADREMRRYEIEYVPKEDCPKEKIKKGMCPPFGYYAKCNPGGCAGGTKCRDSSPCGNGHCIDGKCVCCVPDAKCTNDSQCGAGLCNIRLNTCDCSQLDQTYSCNVRMYPKGTSEKGDSKYIGAVEADFELDFGEKAWWYSLPQDGFCKPDQTLGKDCTWKIKSFSDPSPTMRDLVNKGYKVRCKKYSKSGPCSELNTKEEWENNKRILEEIFTKIPMKAYIG